MLVLRTVMRMVPSICTLGAMSIADVMKPSSGTHALACARVGTSKGLTVLCSTRLAITKGEVRTCQSGEGGERRWAGRGVHGRDAVEVGVEVWVEVWVEVKALEVEVEEVEVA